MPRVSVVTIYYNRRAHVEDSVRSLLEQTLGDDLEIIIVDDQSTDGTAEAIEKVVGHDPRVRFIRQENTGFTPAINRAVRLSTAPYVAVHGSGDISRPDRLRLQAEALDRLREVGIVGCGVMAGDRIVRPAGQSEATRMPLFDTLLDRNPLDHGEVMFRRDLFDSAGGYREAFKFAQDYDLWFRMARHADYAVVPDLLYDRLYLPDSVSGNPSKLILQNKLTKFARQLAQNTDENGRDWLDRFGAPAFLLAAPSRRTAQTLAENGMRLLREGDVAGGREFLRAARDEWASPMIRAAYACAELPPESWRWRQIVQPVLRGVTALSHRRRRRREALLLPATQ